MFFIPSKKVRLQSALSQEALLAQLNAITAERQPGPFKRLLKQHQEKFVGKIAENSFEIYPIPRGKNSFVPKITGSIKSEGGATILDLHMSLHPIVFIFMLLWLGLVLVFALVVLSLYFSDQAEAGQLLWIPFAMLGGGLLMLFLPFKITSHQALKELKASLKASEIKISLN